MSDKEVHHAVERAVAVLMRSDDPPGCLQALLEDAAPPVRAVLANLDPASVMLASTLVVRLRFERLLHGSNDAEAWFSRDSASFSCMFRRYHADVPATSTHPAGEASLWEDWRRSVGDP